MKIALITDTQESVPPLKFGGIEWMVYHLADILGKKGHEMDIYGVGSNENFQKEKDKNYKLIQISDVGLRYDEKYDKDIILRSEKINLALSKAAYLVSKNHYDVIHNHAGRNFMFFANFIKNPIINTLHGELSKEYQKLIYLANNGQPYVSISLNQREQCQKLNYIANIYNGINLESFHFKTINKDSYIAFLGRLAKHKGVLEAIEVAQITQKQLQIAYIYDQALDRLYLEEVKALVDENIFLKRELNREQKMEFLGNAKCLIFPIMWEEPFGLVLVESMAAGTPIVAFARGSIPEIIKDGETGFIVNSSEEDKRGDWIVKKTGIEGLCEAVERIYSMPEEKYREMRRDCRLHVEQNFTIEKMVNEYEKVYEKIIQSKKKFFSF